MNIGQVFKVKKNYWYMAGMLVGLASIIVGIWFLDRQFYGASSLKDITFGADFYTEIYNASRRIYSMLSHINDFIEYVKKGFGFAFIFLGAIDICLFGSKLEVPEKQASVFENASPSAVQGEQE